MRATTMRRLVRTTAVSLLIALQGCSGSSSAPADASGGGDATGRVDRYPFHPPLPDPTNPPAGKYDYQVYVPARHSKATAWPLFVMVHGCGTTADEQMYANRINDIADEEDFLVMYPDNDGNCWRAPSHTTGSIERGGGGDADLIAEMTQETMRNYNVDPERVYIIGMSSGAFQTTATAMAYPDIYAAYGVMAGGGYGMDATCLALPGALGPIYAPLAIDQMGERARIMPFISFGGTADPLGEGTPPLGACSHGAFLEAMATNNVLSGGLIVGDTLTGGRYAPDPSSTVQGQVPDGYPWTREVWRDTAGCEIGERWIIEGMGHFWSGGSSDPQWAEWTDPKGPDASRAAWDFFRRYRKSDTGNECAESRP